MFHRILWFLFFALFIGVTAFMYVNPGMVYIHWAPYVIEVSTLVFALFFLGSLFLTFVLATGLQKIFSFISSWRENKKLVQFKRVESLFIDGFVALEEGDQTLAKEAYETFLAHRSKTTSPLAILFQFLYARKTGTSFESKGVVMQLQNHARLSALAYKDQIQHAFSQKNYVLAEALIKEFLGHHHESPWFLKAAVLTALHQEKFVEALNYLEKKGATTFEKSRPQMEAFIWCRRAEQEGRDHIDYLKHLEKSYDLYPTNKAAILMSDAYVKKGEEKRAKKILLECWIKEPTFEVGSRYVALGETAYDQADLAKTLFKKHPENLVGHSLLILFYLRAELWGDARHELDRLKKKKVSSHLISYFESALLYDEGRDVKAAYSLLRKVFEEEIGSQTSFGDGSNSCNNNGCDCSMPQCVKMGVCHCALSLTTS